MSYQAIVFDMDGVLIDSKECMNLCWKKVQNKTGTEIKFSEYFSRIGKPFKVILSEIGLPPESWAIAEKIYFEAQEDYIDSINAYENIDLMLNELSKDYVLGLVTSKGSRAAGLILNKFGWKFSQVITPDNCARGKPYPDPLLYFTAYERIDPRKCVYIGDMIVDMKAAESAGFAFLRAGWGYQEFESITVESPTKLTQLFKNSK
jgi:HAD superfamily hydrolase (TIGR01549 family)